MTKEKLKKYIYYFAAGLILLLGFSLRLKGYLANPSLWHDEAALGWNILNKSYIELFGKLRFLQIAPPLFLIFTKFLVFITDGYNHIYRCDMILRFIPFVCGNLSLIMFLLVSNKIFNSKWTNIAGLTLFALNPVLINYSFEFKPYSIDVFLSLVAVYIFLSIDFKNNSFKEIFKYGAILASLVWWSFGSAFVIFAGILTLSFKKENPKMFLTLLIPIFVSAILYLKIFITNAYTANSTGMLNFWNQSFVKKDFSNLAQLNTENIQYFFLNIPHFSVLLTILCILAGFILFFKDSKFKYIIISCLTLSSVIAASVMKLYPYSTRMILFLIPFLIFYVVKITDIKKWLIGYIICSLVIIPHFIFTFNYMKIKFLNKGDFSRNMMQIMTKNIKNDDIILFNESSNADYFYYNSFYKLNNKIEYIKPNSAKGETNHMLLKRLNKGTYWLFLAYDYNPKFNNIKEICDWAHKNAQVEFEAKATQSILLKIILN